MNSYFPKRKKCCRRLFPAFPPAVPPIIVKDKVLYISSTDGGIDDNTIEIYNIINPTIPIRVGEFGAEDLDFPNGLAIFTVFGYN